MKITKREAVLLTILILLVVIFIEYQVLYTPFKARYDALVEKDAAVQTEVDTVNALINNLPALKTKKEEALAKVAVKAEPFFNTLKTDALLWNTKELLVGTGLSHQAYQMSENKLVQLTTADQKTNELAYKLSKLATDYKNIATGTEQPAEEPKPNQTKPNDNKQENLDEIEACSITVEMSGSYDQLRQFIISLEALNKTISISSLEIISDTPGTIEATMQVNYYGVTKIENHPDQFNQWSPPQYQSGSGDPYQSEPKLNAPEA